jgi:hypothetical protein
MLELGNVLTSNNVDSHLALYLNLISDTNHEHRINNKIKKFDELQISNYATENKYK